MVQNAENPSCSLTKTKMHDIINMSFCIGMMTHSVGKIVRQTKRRKEFVE